VQGNTKNPNPLLAPPDSAGSGEASHRRAPPHHHILLLHGIDCRISSRPLSDEPYPGRSILATQLPMQLPRKKNSHCSSQPR
jgi:hypothetical protein